MADTRRPRAVTRLRTASDAPDVRRGRDGDRPPMGALDAVETRTLTRPCGRDHGGVDAALPGFGATIAQEWLSRMVAERLADRARRRVLQTGLNAGGRDTDGQGWPPVTGPPPGGRVSPSLAPVDRHDAGDRWCERVVTHHGRGEACRSRDAADVVGALERPPEADRVDTRRGQRLGPCGRERSAEQTRVMPCSRPPPAPTTSVEWLGCAWRWDQDRRGQAQVTRRTARQKRRNALKRFTPWGRAHRHRRLGGLWARRKATLRGDDHDAGVPGTCAGLQPCFSHALGMRNTWLPRHSQRRRDHGAGDHARLAHGKIERPRIVGRPQTSVAASTASAGWRTRVYLKSPVREHRTPGSVRGRSGHWPSYRDDGTSPSPSVSVCVPLPG